MDKFAHRRLCDTYRGVSESLAKATLARSLDSASAARLAAKVCTLADREIKQVTERGDVPLACKPGCNACCQMMPTGAAPEVARIYETVLGWSEPDRRALQARCDDYSEAAEPHRSQGFLRFRRECPFLVDGLCSIYEVRPLFCRGMSSEDAHLCENFNRNPSAEEAFGPNGELGLAQSMIEGLLAGAHTGQGIRLEIPRAIQELLSNSVRLSQILVDPASTKKSAPRDWVHQFEPSSEDPLTNPIEDADYWTFIDRRRRGPMGEVLHFVRPPTTSNAMARICMPSVFESQVEMEHWWGAFQESIGLALEMENWNSLEAFNALADFRPIGAAYQPHSMTECMTKIGQLLHHRVARPIAAELLEPMEKRKAGRVRVGLIGDIGDKSGANWSLGWVRGLDRADFEVTVLKTQGTEDAVSALFQELADHYYRLVGHPLEIAHFIRSLDLDYLIYPDLGDNGAIYHHAIFRLARRQATAWGGPFTSGLPTIDDYLSSELLERQGAQEDYTEQLVTLPRTGLTLEPPRWPKLNAARARFGLPEGFLVSFPQYIIKWLPESDHLLAEISARVKNPIVFFDQGSVDYELDVFKRRMERAGVKSLWLPRTRNTATFRAIASLFDVALDAPGWSGGLTAMHCLSVGTPFVTLPGRFLRQRLAMGFLARAGAPGLAAKGEADYINLVTSGERLQVAKEAMRPDDLFGDAMPLRALEDHIRSAIF